MERIDKDNCYLYSNCTTVVSCYSYFSCLIVEMVRRLFLLLFLHVFAHLSHLIPHGGMGYWVSYDLLLISRLITNSINDRLMSENTELRLCFSHRFSMRLNCSICLFLVELILNVMSTHLFINF